MLTIAGGILLAAVALAILPATVRLALDVLSFCIELWQSFKQDVAAWPGRLRTHLRRP